MQIREQTRPQAHLGLSGELRLTGADGEPVPLTSRRARALVCYLHFAGAAGATRERLAGLLWSDRAEEQARASLRQCLIELRTAQAAAGLDLLTVGRERIALREGGHGAEWAAFERALAAPDGEALTQILQRLADAPLLEDVQLGGLFGEWLEQTRGHLEDSVVQAVQACLKRYEAAAAWPEARRLAQAFLRRHPLDETAVAAAMRADAALGSSSSAHRRFRILKEALAREYGVEPGEAAHEALAALAAPPGPAAPAASEARPSAAPRSGPPLVVVADFEAIGLDGAQSDLTRPIREEVVSGLSRFRDLRVITDPQPAGGASPATWLERGAAYVLGAAMRPDAQGIKLTVRLLRTGDGDVVWSNSLGLPASQLSAAIDRIIAKVVGAVLPTIDGDLVRQARMPANDIFRRYLAARDAAGAAETYDQARAAAAQLEALIADEPGFALPYLPLARLYNTDFGYTRANSSGPAEFARALDLAKSAIAIDRAHVHGYSVAGWSYLRRRQKDAARLYFDQALAMNPFHAERVLEVGFGHIFLGDLDQARQLIDRSLVLNPVPDDMFFADLGLLELIAGDHGRAASYFDMIARPRLWHLIYRAINARLGGEDDGAGSEAARAGVRAIWPADLPLTPESVTAWAASHNPFCEPAADRRFLDAARDLLA